MGVHERTEEILDVAHYHRADALWQSSHLRTGLRCRSLYLHAVLGLGVP